jgi:pilus assembly protein CpaF
MPRRPSAAGRREVQVNIIISGDGSGKTTLLNVLSESIPSRERVVTIEDSAELHLKQDHVVRLETRPPNIEGKGEVTQRNLVKNALRMRPDRIIVGEVRGGEALDMLQAMNTGHDGSISTVHSNSPRDALSRLETMVMMAGMDLPQRAIREQIASAISIVIQLARLSDGARKVIGVTEIVGMEGGIIAMQEIFHFGISGVAEDGKVLGEFKANGIWPKFADRLEKAGVHLSPKTFEI